MWWLVLATLGSFVDLLFLACGSPEGPWHRPGEASPRTLRTVCKVETNGPSLAETTLRRMKYYKRAIFSQI